MRIIESARELLREREAAKVIVADIASRAEVAPATVYNLVGSRDEVLRAVLEVAITELSGRLEPIDAAQPLESVVAVLTNAVQILMADATAHRRAIGAMGDTGDGGWLHTTMAEVLEQRLHEVEATFDGSIPIPQLAELLQIAFRGVLISWSYGHLDDALVVPTSEQMALHVLGTTAHPDVAFAAKRRLTQLARGQA